MEVIALLGLAILFAFAPGAVAARLARVPIALIITIFHLHHRERARQPASPTRPERRPYIEAVDCHGRVRQVVMPEWLAKWICPSRKSTDRPPPTPGEET